MGILQLEQQPLLIQAIFSGELEDVRTALECKQDVNYQDCEKRSPLHAAAYKGDVEIAALLLVHGARINSKDSRWITPLHRACCCGSPELVALLLYHQADITARDRQWQTPLHIAAANNAVDCILLLLNHVPNINVTDRLGRTALHHAAINGHHDVVELLITKGCIVNACDKKDCRPLHCAAHMGHVDTVELLLRGGADINAKDRNQYSPLHVAAASGMSSACTTLLNAGAHVDARNAYGNSPLHIACLNGHLPVCQLLLSYGANIEATNYRGQTPLHISAASTHGVDCLNFLVEKNVDINRQSLDGRTPLHMTAIHGRFTRSKTLIDKGAIVDSVDKNNCTALHIAAQYGHDLLSNTLLAAGADPAKEGRTPLHMSCLSGYVECCRKFLQIGADLNAQDDSGKTPVHCAAYKGSVECLDLLVSNGANFDVIDDMGRLALHYAAVQGHYSCVFTLVGLGSLVNLCDAEGCTPLHLAAAYDIKGKCVEYLLRHKADPKLKDNKGFTPIHYAVSGDNYTGLGFLLYIVGNSYVMYGMDMPCTTPLHLAAHIGNPDILQLLLSYFHDINIRTEHGSTALLLAAKAGHTYCVQMLLRFGSKVSISDIIYNMSPIHYSAKNGHMHCLALLLDNAEDKNVIDFRDSLQRTALMLAVSGGHTESATTLLKCGADPNIIDADQHSSLFRAVVNGQHDAVQLLISQGAKVSIQDVNGKSVLHLAAGCGHLLSLQMIFAHLEPIQALILDNQDCSALHWACHSGNASCVSYLLERNIFQTFQGNVFSPIHCATLVGAEQCVELLCNHYGAEIVKLKDSRDRTSLHISALHGHVDCAKYLIEQGAEIDCKDSDGRTPLVAAAQNGQSQILDLLISSKADMTSYDNNGNTALHLACLKRHSHSALLFLEHIDDINIVNMINNDRKTPLHLSARNGLVNVTRQLISRGSSVLALDINGMTPALCCAPNNSVAQCLALILANYTISSLQNDKELTVPRISYTPFLSPLKRKTKRMKYYDARDTQTDISLLHNPDYFECNRMFNFRKLSSKSQSLYRDTAKPKDQFLVSKNITPLDQKTLKGLLQSNTHDEIREFIKHEPKDSGCYIIENFQPEDTDLKPIPQTSTGHNLHHSQADTFIPNESRISTDFIKKMYVEANKSLKTKNSSSTTESVNEQKSATNAISKNPVSPNMYILIKKIAKGLVEKHSPKANRNKLIHLLLQAFRKAQETRSKSMKTSTSYYLSIKMFEEEFKSFLRQYVMELKNQNKFDLTQDPLESPENIGLIRMLKDTIKQVSELQSSPTTDDQPSQSGVKKEEIITKATLRQNKTQKVTKHSVKQNLAKKSKSSTGKLISKADTFERPSTSTEFKTNQADTIQVVKRNPKEVIEPKFVVYNEDIKELFIRPSSSFNIPLLEDLSFYSPKPKIIETSNDDDVIKVDQVIKRVHSEESTNEKRKIHQATKTTRVAFLSNLTHHSMINATNKKLIEEGIELIKSTKDLQCVSEYLKMFDATIHQWPDYIPQGMKVMKQIIAIINEQQWLESLKSDLAMALDKLDAAENFHLQSNIDLSNIEKNMNKISHPTLRICHIEPLAIVTNYEIKSTPIQTLSNDVENNQSISHSNKVLIEDETNNLENFENETEAIEKSSKPKIISGIISMVSYSSVQEEMQNVLESGVPFKANSIQSNEVKPYIDESEPEYFEISNSEMIDENTWDTREMEVLPAEIKLKKKSSFTGITKKKLLKSKEVASSDLEKTPNNTADGLVSFVNNSNNISDTSANLAPESSGLSSHSSDNEYY